ncbi:TetR/AcrR family transcriptional regulator [Nonomuraea typhae]|uniref:TetR/AcrR family transcriptional regulator n=1 Tax=Nonomuraea typhae TaxID=2603600 RepID=A0ABW7YM28_9ACTN
MPVARGSTLDPARTRAAILSTATGLLYERGLDGVGVAELCAATGASKETLYRHFGSKEGLISAVLEERSARITRWLQQAADSATTPSAKLEAVFDALVAWHDSPEFRGCAILNAAAQHHDAPTRAIAVRHLETRRALLREIAADAGAADPGTLATQLLVLISGATVTATHLAGRRPAEAARAAALALLGA